MRTAEEVMKAKLPEGYFRWMKNDRPIRMKLFKEIINEARIEAIRECAEMAESLPGSNFEAFGGVDKQSILKLIDEVK